MNKAQKARGRLIELMYVMLTVMVALNIYDVPLKEYVTMNENIEKNIKILYEKHSQLIAKIKQKNIDKNEKFKGITDKIFDLYESEKNFLEKLYELKKRIIIESGGYDKEGKIKKIHDKLSVKKIMLQEGYKDFINNLFSEFSEKIDLFCKELDLDNNIKIPEIDFNKNSLITTIVYFSQMQNNIVSMSDCIFDRLLDQLNFEQPIFDKYELIVIPKNNVVIAGKNYEADVFLNVKIEETEPIITINNEKIEVKNNIGKIKIKTSQNLNFDKDGKFENVLDINFIQKNPVTQKDINLKKQIFFTIIKKQNLEGESVVNKSLYKLCKNNYVIKNNDPEEKNNYKFILDAGNVIEKTRTQTKTELIIIPYANKCSLHVYNEDNEIFSQIFDVQEVPIPQIKIFINDKVVNDGTLFESSTLRNIYLNIISDRNFSSLYPEDAIFKVKKWSILFCKNKKIIDRKNIENTDRYDFKNDKKILKVCDKIIIVIEKIYRINFEQKEIDILENGSVISRSYNLFTKEENEE